MKNNCKICNPKILCEHNKLKTFCYLCGGKGACIHNKNKTACTICNRDIKCKTEECFKRKYEKYNGYCMTCCIEKCPETKIDGNIKVKERSVVKRVTEKYSDKKWVKDKRIEGGKQEEDQIYCVN